MLKFWYIEKNALIQVCVQEEKGDGGGLFSPSMMTDAASPTEQVNKEPERKGFMSRFFRGMIKVGLFLCFLCCNYIFIKTV